MALDLTDKTSNGNNLTNNGGATEVTSSLPFVASTKAVDFASASSQYLSATDSASLSLATTFTVEFWVKFTSLPTAGATISLINKRDRTTDGGYRIFLTEDSGNYDFGVEVCADNTNSVRDLYTITLSLSTGTWYHFAVTCDTGNASATTFEFFKDGTSQGHGAAGVAGNVSTIIDNARPFLIGAGESITTPERFTNGKFDDVRVWNIVRTGVQIANNYQSELIGTESGLVAYYPFEDITVISTQGGAFLLNFV